MNSPLEIVLQQARTLPPEALPRLLGDLTEIMATAQQRLSVPTPVIPIDELLSVGEAAERLHCSKVYLYKTALPFKRKLGRKLLFSQNGITEYLRKQR